MSTICFVIRWKSCTCILATTPLWPRFCTLWVFSMELLHPTRAWSSLSCSRGKAFRWSLLSSLNFPHLPSGENLLQEHNRHCLPPNTPWMQRAVPHWQIHRWQYKLTLKFIGDNINLLYDFHSNLDAQSQAIRIIFPSFDLQYETWKRARGMWTQSSFWPCCSKGNKLSCLSKYDNSGFCN